MHSHYRPNTSQKKYIHTHARSHAFSPVIINSRTTTFAVNNATRTFTWIYTYGYIRRHAGSFAWKRIIISARLKDHPAWKCYKILRIDGHQNFDICELQSSTVVSQTRSNIVVIGAENSLKIQIKLLEILILTRGTENFASIRVIKRSTWKSTRPSRSN